jgi:hypothetical protein
MEEKLIELSAEELAGEIERGCAVMAARKEVGWSRIMPGFGKTLALKLLGSNLVAYRRIRPIQVATAAQYPGNCRRENPK